MRRTYLLALGLALVSACAGTKSAPPPDPAAGPPVRCRTVLEVRPGSFGASGSATPVEECEPVGADPAGAATPEEAPLGTPVSP